MNPSLLTVAIIAVLVVLLASCSSAVTTACPTLVPYTQEFQDRLADAVERGVDAEINEVLQDYAGLRDQVRACQGTPA